MAKGFSSSWTSIVYQGRNDVVFESRNKEYGAYEIRRDYGKFLTRAMIISTATIVLLFAIPFAYNLIVANMEEVDVPTDIVMDLAPPPLDKAEPPPPPPPPPPPVMETIKFTPPEVTEEDVPEDEIPPPQEQLQETTVAEQTQEGDPDALVIAETNNAVIEDNNVYDLVAIQEPAQFPGGEQALMAFIAKNVHYPEMAKENGIQGKVAVSFVIDKDGSITDVVLMRGLKGCPECDNESIRVVKMLPKWTPGKQNGKAVKMRFIYPFNYKLK